MCTVQPKSSINVNWILSNWFASESYVLDTRDTAFQINLKLAIKECSSGKHLS